jgi:Ca2+-binding RTX toxin-like protein
LGEAFPEAPPAFIECTMPASRVEAEPLEPRRLFAASPALSRGTLIVNGQLDQPNSIKITAEGSSVDVNLNGVITSAAVSAVKRFRVSGGEMGDDIRFIDANSLLKRKRTVISCGEGDDLVVANPYGTNRITGGGGDDVITGGELRDFIAGGDGNDALDGAGGGDRLYGGRGADVLKGGAGNDQLLAGSGNDHVDGGPGRDLLRGDLGEDVLNGGSDGMTGRADGIPDTLFGGGGSDTFFGDDRDREFNGNSSDPPDPEVKDSGYIGGFEGP